MFHFRCRRRRLNSRRQSGLRATSTSQHRVVLTGGQQETTRAFVGSAGEVYGQGGRSPYWAMAVSCWPTTTGRLLATSRRSTTTSRSRPTRSAAVRPDWLAFNTEGPGHRTLREGGSELGPAAFCGRTDHRLRRRDEVRGFCHIEASCVPWPTSRTPRRAVGEAFNIASAEEVSTLELAEPRSQSLRV
jgi:hypothetical protein